MLTIQEFMKKNNHRLNLLFVDKFWNNIQDDKPILIDDQIVRWLTGNQNSKIHNSRKNIKDKIKKFNLDYKIISYNEVLKLKEFNKNNFETKQKKYLRQMKFILINLFDFKMLCMMSNTIYGHQIKVYFIQIENILKHYLFYQCQYYKKSYSDVIKEIKNYEHNKIYLEKKLKELKDNEEYLKNRKGYVYFLNEENNHNYFKIGFTYNLKKRLSNLQTGNRRKLEYYKYKLVSNPSLEENMLHKRFKSKRVLNEWFKIDKSYILFI